jgi:hypothetical protein
MPRKKVLGPATVKQVLEFFQTSGLELAQAIRDVASEIITEREAVARRAAPYKADLALAEKSAAKRQKAPRTPESDGIVSVTPPLFPGITISGTPKA